MKEIELVDLFCDFLSKNNYIYKRELRKGSYHNEGYIDIVIKNNGLLIGIEAKILGISSVISQASSNRLRLPYNYILILKISKKSLNKAKQRGLGVIIYDSKKNTFSIIQKPHFPQWYWLENYYYKILRNWIQNRIGRVISPNSKELPENYNEEKLSIINPSYDWVGKTYDPYSIDWKGLGFSVFPIKKPIIHYIPPKKKIPKNKKLDSYI